MMRAILTQAQLHKFMWREAMGPLHTSKQKPSLGALSEEKSFQALNHEQPDPLQMRV
jgi:hypothetical protein